MTTSKDDTIVVRISKTLAERIVAGAIEPGSKLRQDHIAEEFGASHVPVREAFRRLELQGLVVSEPRRGVRVAGFSMSEIKEVAEMRAALEVLALRHAAPHLTKAILDQAEDANRIGDKAGDVQAWEEANRAFHRLILTPCAMPRLLKTIEDLHTASARFSCSLAGGLNGTRRPIGIIEPFLSRCEPDRSKWLHPCWPATFSGSARSHKNQARCALSGIADTTFPTSALAILARLWIPLAIESKNYL